MKATKTPIHAVWSWVRRQPPKVKAFLAVVTGMAALVLLRFIVHDHDNLFVAAEAVHSIGICVLIYKLMKEKTCAGTIHIFFFFFFFIYHIRFLGFLKSLVPSTSDRVNYQNYLLFRALITTLSAYHCYLLPEVAFSLIL